MTMRLTLSSNSACPNRREWARLGCALAALLSLAHGVAADEPPAQREAKTAEDLPPSPPAAGDPPAEQPAPAPASAAGVEPEPSLPEGHVPVLERAVEPKSEVRTGELVKLTIRADAKLGDDVTIAEQSFAPFEVHKKLARTEPPSGDRQRFVFELELLAFEPGDAPIPSIALRVVTKDSFVGSVKTEPIPFRVRGYLANEPNAQPKLETKPVAVLQDNWLPIYILGGLAAAAVVALITLLVSRYLRNRAKKAAPPPPPRPPWEIAVEALAALRRKRQTMIDAGQGALFVEQLNHVLRAYLGGRYAFDGLETTTDEMLAQLKAHHAGLGFTQEVGMFLGRCDLVKFAKVEPDADEVDLLFAKAQDLVQFSGPEEGHGLTSEAEAEGGAQPGSSAEHAALPAASPERLAQARAEPPSAAPTASPVSAPPIAAPASAASSTRTAASSTPAISAPPISAPPISAAPARPSASAALRARLDAVPSSRAPQAAKPAAGSPLPPPPAAGKTEPPRPAPLGASSGGPTASSDSASAPAPAPKSDGPAPGPNPRSDRGSSA